MDFTNIIFRGQRQSDKTWSFGDLEHIAVGMYISVNINTWHMHDDPTIDWGSNIYIESKTVGVNFGHKDINGKLIFTGDIVKDIDDCLYLVVFDGYQLSIDPIKTSDSSFFVTDIIIKAFKIQVIGNIYDNPELLKQQSL